MNVRLFLEISLLFPSKIRNYFMLHIESENGHIKWIWLCQYSKHKTPFNCTALINTILSIKITIHF